MEKIWYIDIEGRREGPFSIYDLKRDDRVTPDTLVWKEGFANWKPIREVAELKEIFADETSTEEEKPQEKEPPKRIASQDEIVLDLRKDPPYFFWFFFLLILLVYFLTQLLWNRS